jgi:ABC-type polysaccharide/polyol phosphate transport system ATPase subunit
MAVAISAEGLSKQYKIGQYRAAYGTLRDSLAAGARRLRTTGHVHKPDETIWALKDVSFEASEKSSASSGRTAPASRRS